MNSVIVLTVGISLQNIFSYPPIIGVTINTVKLSAEFRTLLHGMILLGLFTSLPAFIRLRRMPWRTAMASSLLMVFLASGILYALHAEIGWASWLRTDINRFGGLSSEEKLMRLEQGLYLFAREARKVVGTGDYQLFSDEPYFRERAEYFMLPARKRAQADIIIVLVDPKVKFDAKSATLVREKLKIRKVQLVSAYADDAFILRRR